MRATVAKRLRRVARITCDARIPARQLVHKVTDARHPQYNTAIWTAMNELEKANG